MRPVRDGEGHAPPVLAPWKSHQQSGGGQGRHTLRHVRPHARQAGRLTAASWASPLLFLPEGAAGPAVVACGAPVQAPPRWPRGRWRRLRAHSHRAWRGSPSGHRIRPMRHHSKPNMDGKSRDAVFCLAGRLGLGRGGGCGRLSCRRRPTGRGRAPGACAGGATKPPQPPSGGRCPRPGHRCGADVPSDRASARRSRGRRRSHPRDDARRRPSLKGIGCGSDLRAKGCGRGWSPKRPAQVVRGGPPAASSAARLTLGLTRSPENMIGGRRHLVFPCQA